MTAPDQVAARLRAAVKAAGGAAVIARATGIPQTTIGRYLGGRQMRFDYAAKIAAATSVSLDWLATGAGFAGDPLPAPAAVGAPKATSLAAAFRIVAAVLEEAERPAGAPSP